MTEELTLIGALCAGVTALAGACTLLHKRNQAIAELRVQDAMRVTEVLAGAAERERAIVETAVNLGQTARELHAVTRKHEGEVNRLRDEVEKLREERLRRGG